MRSEQEILAMIDFAKAKKLLSAELREEVNEVYDYWIEVLLWVLGDDK